MLWATPRPMKPLVFLGICLAAVAVAKGGTSPNIDPIVLSLEATPSLTLDQLTPSVTTGPWASPYRMTTPPGTRVNNVDQGMQQRVLDTPGPGYRKLIEWYQNVSRPLPKVE